MSNKRQNDAWKAEKGLERSGYNIQGRRNVRMHRNPSDETLRHKMAKMAAAHVLAEKGYRVDSEVEQTDGPIADVLAYGLDGRDTIVVELESQCSDSLRYDNVDKYVKGVVDECHTIDVAELPDDVEGMAEHIETQLFGRSD